MVKINRMNSIEQNLKSHGNVGVRIKWIFFGTSEFSVIVLEELKAKGFTPEAIVTVEDKPSGRKLIPTAPPAKVWAEKNRIPLFQFKTLKTKETEDALKSLEADVFVVRTANLSPKIF